MRVRGKRGERERNNFDFACVGERERNNLMCSGYLIDGMDATTLTMSLIPMFTVKSV